MVRPTNLGGPRELMESESSTGTVSGDDVDWPTGPTGSSEPSPRDQWKQPVRAATTANITISTALNNGDTLDGVTLATGDRVLVKDQSTTSQNGIYVVGTTPTRAVDFDEGSEVLGAIVYVVDGTTNAGTAWAVDLVASPIIDIDAITFAGFGGGGSGSIDADEDGSTVVSGASTFDFRHGLDVTAPGGGVARVAVDEGELTHNSLGGLTTGDPHPQYVLDGAVTTSGLTQATARLLGRTTASTGAIEEISVGSGLSLSAGSLSATGGGSGTLSTVEEVDGSPTDSAVTKLVFPNGTLGISGHVATYTPAGGSGLAFDTHSLVEGQSNAANAGTFTVTMSTTLNNGDVLIIISGTAGGNVVSTPSATNITFTSLASKANGAVARVEIWKGVCGASPGQVITFTRASGSNPHAGMVGLFSPNLAGTLGSSADGIGTGTMSMAAPVVAASGQIIVGGAIGNGGSGNQVSPLFRTVAAGTNFGLMGYRLPLVGEQTGWLGQHGATGTWAAIVATIS